MQITLWFSYKNELCGQHFLEYNNRIRCFTHNESRKSDLFLRLADKIYWTKESKTACSAGTNSVRQI